jgi:hypothetical protein
LSRGRLPFREIRQHPSGRPETEEHAKQCHAGGNRPLRSPTAEQQCGEDTASQKDRTGRYPDHQTEPAIHPVDGGLDVLQVVSHVLPLPFAALEKRCTP